MHSPSLLLDAFVVTVLEAGIEQRSIRLKIFLFRDVREPLRHSLAYFLLLCCPSSDSWTGYSTGSTVAVLVSLIHVCVGKSVIKKRSMTYEDEHVIKIGKDVRKDV